MKLVLASLVLGFLSLPALADSGDSQPRFMKNFDAKIRALEDYTVTHIKPGQKPVRAAQTSGRDGLAVKLIPAKKKS